MFDSSLLKALDDEKDTNWFLPVVNVVLRNLRFAAYRAEYAESNKKQNLNDGSSSSSSSGSSSGNNRSSSPLSRVQDCLQRYLQKMNIDRNTNLAASRKLGCLFVIVHLFKIYFRLNSLKLCTYLIKNASGLPTFSLFPLSHVVSYNYYLGRLMIFEEQYDKALDCLFYALQHCPAHAKKNKRSILQYLIPIKLLKSSYPLPKLLEKYQLHQYTTLIQSIKDGDLKLFNQSLETYQEFFISKGIFLILEKLKTFVYRNLFRKV